MLTLDIFDADQWLTTWIASKAANECQHLIAKVREFDERPSNAIEAAKAWLSNPCEETAHHANLAADEAYSIYSNLPHEAIGVNIISDIAYVATCFADSVYSESFPADSKACISYVARLLGRGYLEYVNILLNRHLIFIVDYMHKNNQQINSFEYIFNQSSDTDKEKLLFYMDMAGVKE